jgi:hypothetical protein
MLDLVFLLELQATRTTLVLGASLAMSAAAALPALFSSMKEMVELITNKTTIPTKSCQSGGAD